MKTTSAWLEIDSTRLPDFISSMLFQSERHQGGWILVSVSDSERDISSPPISLSSTRSALVRFELPARMECLSQARPDKIVSLSNILAHWHRDSRLLFQHVWVPCLPAIFARDVIFSDEMAFRSAESNLRRLMEGRGKWLNLKVADVSKNTPASIVPIPDHGPAMPSVTSEVRLEKLASGVATAVVLGYSDIGKGRMVTFDTGSVALLRQLRTGVLDVPGQKTRMADTKRLVKKLFETARAEGLKPGVQPGKLPDPQTGALQLAWILRDLEDNRNDLFQTSSSEPAEREHSPDQAVLEFILKRMVEQDSFPTIQVVSSILERTIDWLNTLATDLNTEGEKVLEALKILKDNVESPEGRIDRFRETFGELPGVTGIAHVFWGWSDDPLKNLEHRLAHLKSTYRRAHQAANIVFAVAGGAERLPARFLRSRLWTAAYESAWQLLLSVRDPIDSDNTDKEIWEHEAGGLTRSDMGPTVEIKLHGQIPLGLKIRDPLFVVQTLAMDHLNSEKLRENAANAILIALDGDTSRLSADLKGLHEISLTVRLRKNLTGEIQGANIHFSKVKNTDLTFEHHWADPLEAARELTEGKLLSKILAALSKERLEKLRLELTDRSEHQSS